MPKPGLSQKNRRDIFCREYVRHGNGVRAAITAGYARTSAHVQASRLLDETEIREQIEILQQARINRLELDTDQLVAELVAIGFARITDLGEIIDGTFRIKDTVDMDEVDVAAIAEINQIVIEDEIETFDGDIKRRRTTKLDVKLHDRIGALKELIRIIGLGQDFNSVLTAARQYGLNIVRDPSGKYICLDERWKEHQSQSLPQSEN